MMSGYELSRILIEQGILVNYLWYTLAFNYQWHRDGVPMFNLCKFSKGADNQNKLLLLLAEEFLDGKGGAN